MDGSQDVAMSFEEFYRRYYVRVRAFAAQGFGESDADDIAQEAMLRAYGHFDELRDLDRMWPWLAIVTRNIGRDHVRTWSRSVPTDLSAIDDVAPPLPDVVAAEVIASDNRRRLGRALRRLTERDRSVLTLREIHGLSVITMAAQGDVTANGMRQRLFRARQLLAREYQAAGGERLIMPLLPRLPIGGVVRRLTEPIASVPGSLQDSTAAAMVIVVGLVVGVSTPPPAVAASGRRPVIQVPGEHTREMPPAPIAPPRIPLAVPIVAPNSLIGDPVPDVGAPAAASPNCARYRHVAAGQDHTVAVAVDRTVSAWGANSQGQLGDGTGTNRPVPVKVTGLSNVRTVAAGAHFSLAVTADDSVWAWGDNWFGQLGDGARVNRFLPVQVADLADVQAVAAGDSHSLAVTADGSAWAWGFNGEGQLGDGTPIDRSSPVRVVGLSDVRSVAAGYFYSLAVTADGSLWAWGDNEYGQLGDGTTVGRSSPVRVPGLSNVLLIAAGGYHSLAVTADGSVWTWGLNSSGQLGDGTTVGRSSPVRVAGLSNVRTIAGGDYHSLATTTAGSVWAWGHNESGRLGDASTINRLRPVRLLGLPSARGIAGGFKHSVAVASDDTVWAWGSNGYGRLGDGTLLDRHAPVLTACAAALQPARNSLCIGLERTAKCVPIPDVSQRTAPPGLPRTPAADPSRRPA